MGDAPDAGAGRSPVRAGEGDEGGPGAGPSSQNQPSGQSPAARADAGANATRANSRLAWHRDIDSRVATSVPVASSEDWATKGRIAARNRKGAFTPLWHRWPTLLAQFAPRRTG